MASNSPNRDWDETLATLFGLGLGLLFMAGGLWVRQRELTERETLQETQGTVVDSVKRRERDSSNNQDKETYAPVIEFSVNGDRTRFTGRYESYRTSNGHQVVVRYDPQQPEKTARVVDPLEGLTPWGMLGLGGFAVVTSLSSLLPLRRLISRDRS